MTGFTQHTNFRNAIDVKSLALQITNEYYPQATEKLMETRQEYLQGCRESDIRALVSGDNFSDLIDRIANFIDGKQSAKFKDLMVDFIVENNLVDEEELAR
jgi:hypothetical protein